MIVLREAIQARTASPSSKKQPLFDRCFHQREWLLGFYKAGAFDELTTQSDIHPRSSRQTYPQHGLLAPAKVQRPIGQHFDHEPESDE